MKRLIILLLIVGCAPTKPPVGTFYIGMSEKEFMEKNNISFDSSSNILRQDSGIYKRVNIFNSTILPDLIRFIEYKEEGSTVYWFSFMQDTLIRVSRGFWNNFNEKHIDYDKYATPPE